MIVILLSLIIVDIFSQKVLTNNFTNVSGFGSVSSNNKYGITENDNYYSLWDIELGKKIRDFHIDSLNYTGFSKNCKYIITSSSSDNAVKLWDIKTNYLVKTFTGHINEVTSVDISIDNRYIVASTNNDAWNKKDDVDIILWDFASCQILKKIKKINGKVGISNDGNYFYCYDGQIYIWNLTNFRKVRKINKYFIDKSYSDTLKENKTLRKLQKRDGEIYISKDENFILKFHRTDYFKGDYILYDLTKNKSTILEKDRSEDCAFSADGKYLAICRYSITNIYNTENAEVILTLNEKFNSVIFNSKSDKLISASIRNGIQIWDIKTGKLISKLKTDVGVGSYNFVLYGDKLFYKDSINQHVLFDIEKNKNTLKFNSTNKFSIINIGITNDITLDRHFFDVKKSIFKLVGNHGTSDYHYEFALSPDSKLFYNSRSQGSSSLGRSYYCFYDIKKDSIIKTGENGYEEAPIFNPNNSYFFFLSNLYDVDCKKKYSLCNEKAINACFNSTGELIACHDKKNKLLNIYNVKSGTLVNSISILESDTYNFLFWYNNDNSIILGNNYTLNFYDLNQKKIIKTIQNLDLDDVVISPSKKFLIFDRDSVIEKYDVISDKSDFNIKSPYEYDYNSQFKNIVISKDNKFIIATFNRYIKIYNAENGEEIRTIIGESDFEDIILNFNGELIISTAYDGKNCVWKLSDGRLLATFIVSGTDYVCYTPDGHFDGTEKGIEQLHYVESLEIYPLTSLYEQYYTPNLLARVLSGEELTAPDIDINDLKPKPEIKITSPNSDIRGFVEISNVLQSEIQKIDITVQVTDMGGGIDEILLYHNGKLVETTNRGFKPVEKENDIQTKTFSISLTDGENIIKATAFNNQRTEAIPDEITINYKSTSVVKSNLYVLILGIDNYKNPQYSLNYAIADALAFKTEIEKGSKDIFNTVNITYLTDANATKTKITEPFNNLSSTITQNDVFVMYYAGHGVMSVEDKPQFYIIPYDVTQLYGDNNILKTKAISAAELQSYSMAIKAQKQLFIFDACQSGGMTEHIAARGQAEEKAIALLARSTGTYWFSASGSEQFATEFAEIGHGVYTYAILLGLQGQADAGSKDKQITVQELDVFIKEKVPELSEKYKGQAQYPKSYGGGDDFPLIIIK